MKLFSKLFASLAVLTFFSVAFVGCDHPSSSDNSSLDNSSLSNGSSGNNLIFRENKNTVVAGDIAVSIDGGTTLKYVPAKNWNSSTYSTYETIGVCVNSTYMIDPYKITAIMNYDYANDFNFGEGWNLPTIEQFKEIYGVKAMINESLEKLGRRLLAGEFWALTSGSAYTALNFNFNTGDEQRESKNYNVHVIKVHELN